MRIVGWNQCWPGSPRSESQQLGDRKLPRNRNSPLQTHDVRNERQRDSRATRDSTTLIIAVEVWRLRRGSCKVVEVGGWRSKVKVGEVREVRENIAASR